MAPLGIASVARAQWVPDRPVRLVVVENRAGAGGVLGAEAVARAAPDGLTVLVATAGQLTIAKAIGRRWPSARRCSPGW
jgi:hypothetical protein